MPHPAHRRDFLKTAVAIVASVAGATPGVRADDQPQQPKPHGAKEPREQPGKMPVIDTHQHLWDLKQFRLPWVKKDSPLNANFTLAEYEQATAGLNIVKTIYMEVDVDPAQQQQEADFVIEMCKRADTPMVGGVVSGRPASDGFAKYVRQFRDGAYIKGIRQVLHVDGTPPGFCLEEKFKKGIQLLGELGLSFDLCMRHADLGDAIKLADACPDTRFILDHCGNATVNNHKDRTQWKRDMVELAKRKNVVACKVSGIVASATKDKWTVDDLAPIVTHTLEAFGPDRVMFAGDWPVCTLAATFKQWLDAAKAIVKDKKEEQQRKLFHDNAVRVYGLEA